MHNNDRVFVDQESVPDELRDVTLSIMDGFRRESGVDEMHLGTDWVLTQTESGERLWVPREVNGGEPQLVYENEDVSVARYHATMLARQLRRVALAGTTLYTGKEN